MTWTNGPLVLYHGTNSVAHKGKPGLYQTFKYAVDLKRCRDRTDFGRGFYTTTSHHQAKQWANESVRKLGPAMPGSAIVLRFEVDRNELGRLETLFFVRPTGDYFDLVAHCRAGGIGHRRRPPKPRYDVVCGPVAIGQQLLIIHDADQVSFHSREAVDCLCKEDVVVYDVAAAPSGLLP